MRRPACRRGLLAVAALLPVLAFGQIPQANPVVDAAVAIGRSGLGTGSGPAASPTKFRPSGQRISVSSYARVFFETDEETKAFKDGLIQLIENYEASMKGTEMADDFSTALAFSVSVLYSAAKGEDLQEEAFLALAKRLQGTFDKPGVRAASDHQKQEAYEWALCSSGMVLTTLSAANTEADKSKVKSLAALQIEVLIGTKLDYITVKDKQFVIQPVEPPVASAGADKPSSAGLAPGFECGTPPGWVKDGAWLVHSTQDGDHVVTAQVRFPAAIPANGNMGDALRKLWKENVPAPLADAAGGMVYRRYVGAKLFSQFIFGKGTEEGRKSDSVFSLFLIDCGSYWQPVVVAQTFRDVNPNAAGESFSAQYSYGTSADYAETMLATFRCPLAPNQALAPREALVGDYSYGSSNTMHWENIYTGATSMTFVSSGGSLDLRKDGTFTYTFTSANGQVGATVFRSAKGAGTYTIQGDILTCTYTSYDQGDSYKRTESQHRIAGLAVFPGGEKAMVLLDDLKSPVNNVTVASRGTWYSTKK